MVNRLLNSLFRPVFPATCILCGASGHSDQDICRECLADLPRIGHCCHQCALPLPENGICGSCLSKPPRFDHCIAPFRYEGPVRDLITGLKFHQQLANARLMAWLLFEHLGKENEMPELLLPVPLHPQRIKTRGYNQTLELARHLCHSLDIPLSTRNCIRSRATTAQADLPKKQRKKNMKGAFALKQPITARHVVVFDDVVTTGSTADELSRVLRQAGVERVDVWALARTP